MDVVLGRRPGAVSVSVGTISVFIRRHHLRNRMGRADHKTTHRPDAIAARCEVAAEGCQGLEASVLPFAVPQRQEDATIRALGCYAPLRQRANAIMGGWCTRRVSFSALLATLPNENACLSRG